MKPNALVSAAADDRETKMARAIVDSIVGRLGVG